MEIILALLLLILIIGIFVILNEDNRSYDNIKNKEPYQHKPDFIILSDNDIDKESFNNAINTKRASNPNDSNNHVYNSKHNKNTVHKTSNLWEKGTDYERFIANKYRLKGYKVTLHGILKGKKDGGIDIICTKDNQLILIQCKNWESHHKWKINHEKLKSFIGSCTEYVNENRLFGVELKLLFITSNDILDNSAKGFLKNSKTLRHQIIIFKN